MGIQDEPAAAVLAASVLAGDARGLVHRADAVPLPPQQVDGWASPAARAYADDVRALHRAVADLRGALAELAGLLAGAVR
ncbi:hypothetical protein [uncultured Amnibacterium sp.]|uniref:hypothetical protein n=1 Tax=uncultured Amnibacterium sp. TaxID=1631851 RepID=UPI0035C96A72